MDPSIKVETIRGSTHTKIFSVTKDKIDIYEKFQSQNPNFKYKKLSLEMINHIVKKNSKMLKVNLFYNTSNEKNMLFEYFRNNKYQENYLRARLSTQKNNKTHEIGMPQNNPNHFMSTQTLNFLKQLKSKNNSQIEEELLEKQEKENEQKTILDQKGEQKEQRLCLNPFTVINPYNLSYTQESSFSEKEIESVNSGNTNFGKQIISSKHNMFRMKPKNISVMKNHYKF